jgi:hypothetical protein
MQARRGLISSRFLVLLLPLILVSCSGGSSEAPQSLTVPPGPPPPPSPAGLLYRTDTTLVRSQTDGSGQVVLAEEAARIETVVVSGATVAYDVPQSPSHTGNIPRDIVTVQLDGKDQHRVRHSAGTEWFYLLDMIGSWVLHTVGGPDFFPPSSIASILVNGTAPRILSAATGSGEVWQVPTYERHVGGRAIIGFTGNYFSLLPDGTDLRQLTAYPPVFAPFGNVQVRDFLVGVSGVVGESIIYSTIPNPSSLEESPKLFAVPVLGGLTVKLGEGPDYELLKGVVDTRVVYDRCVLLVLPDLNVTLDQCNAFSVRQDGHGRVALTDTHDINWVQGVIGQQVIIRRSHGGPTDELFGIPVTGGVETPILTLSFDDEFVMALVEGRIILQRPTGLWSIQAAGSELRQLTTEDHAFEAVNAAGPFTCFNRGSALWCVPADGSGPATQVTADGRFVAEL